MAFTEQGTLTNAGANLLASLLDGEKLKITRGVMGEGTLGSQDPATLTNVLTPVVALPALSVSTPYEGQASVRFDENDTDVPRDFYWREFGVYAQRVTTGAEALLIYNHTTTPDFITAGGGNLQTIAQVIKYQSAANITIVIDESIAYVTEDEYTAFTDRAEGFATAAQGQKADDAVPKTRRVNGKPLSADITLTKSDVGMGSVDNTADSTKDVATAQKLKTARKIGDAAFDGSADISLQQMSAMPWKDAGGNDCNAITETGRYKRTDWVNRPTEAMDGQGILDVFGYESPGWVHQYWYTPHAITAWHRVEVNGVWSDWTTCYDSYTPAAIRNLIGAQPYLGFTPVQQGGGQGQHPNKMYLGWNGGAINAQVDNIPLGTLLHDGDGSGVLPIERGGTKGTTPEEALANLGGFSKYGGELLGALGVHGRVTALDGLGLRKDYFPGLELEASSGERVASFLSHSEPPRRWGALVEIRAFKSDGIYDGFTLNPLVHRAGYTMNALYHTGNLMAGSVTFTMPGSSAGGGVRVTLPFPFEDANYFVPGLTARWFTKGTSNLNHVTLQAGDFAADAFTIYCTNENANAVTLTVDWEAIRR